MNIRRVPVLTVLVTIEAEGDSSNLHVFLKFLSKTGLNFVRSSFQVV